MAQGPIMVREYAGMPTLNLSTDTVVRSSPGYVGKVAVNATATSAAASAGAIYDAAITAAGGTAASRLAFVIPNTQGIYTLYWPMATGVRVVPAAGAILSVTLA